MTVGIVRKIATIVCSLLIYPKPFSANYVFGGVLLLAALSLEARNLRRKKRDAPPDRRGAACGAGAPPPPTLYSKV